MAIYNFTATVRPTKMLKRMLEHRGDVSETSKYKVFAKRNILGYNVTFYENGLRETDGGLTEEEEFNSEILRLAHASLLINDAVGDQKQCYVDARRNPVEVIIYGYPADRYIKRAKNLIKNGHVEPGFILDQHLEETKNVGHVRLFGR